MAVRVSAGATTTGVNAQLTAPGAIGGTVTSASGGRLQNVRVKVLDRSGNHVEVLTDAAGSYTVLGLPASTAGYTVCFDGSSASVGTGAAGYARQCYKNVAWNGQDPPPSGTTAVPVKAGATTGINAQLAGSASIAGRVTATIRGGVLTNVNVAVFDSSAHVVGATATASDGTYRVSGLGASATGYRVCFDASFATGGASTTGYVSKCYKTAVWNTNGPPPAGTTAVPVSAGKAVIGINAALATAGSVAGKVTAATTGGGLGNVSVVVFDSNRTLVALGSTSSDGTYSVLGLPPSATGYSVCFDASQATGVGFAADASQCYKKIAWTDKGPPATGTTRVPVSAGARTSGINASLGVAPPGTAAVALAPTTQPVLENSAPRHFSGEEPNGVATRSAAPATAATSDCDPNDLPTGSEGPDADGDECNFTVQGGHAFVVGGPRADLAGQSITDSSSANQCSETKKVMYSVELTFVLSLLATRGAFNAVTFLLHWADGSGTDMIRPDGSNISNLARADGSFKDFDNQIQAEAERRWNGGDQHPVLSTNTIDWGGILTAADLFYSFGGTQGLDLDGSATNTNGKYVGDITYTITDTYGWNSLPTFTKSGNVPGDNFRPAMHYLQTYCGSTPTQKHGPHWFKSGVIVKVPIQ
jgi:hypothetical protein